VRCLWITRIDPRPADAGELIYSNRMMDAFAKSGAEVTAVCLARPGSPRSDGAIEDGVRWSVVPGENRPSWQSVISPLPIIACRCAIPPLRRKLTELLSEQDWETAVLDSLSVGWALPIIRAEAARRGRGPRVVYLSHNHEETTRGSVARNFHGNPVERMLLLADARKAAALERAIVNDADLVTAIAPADAVLYCAQRKGRPVLELSPGYDGRELAERRITADMPRCAVVVGSFEWVAKQMNLRDFVAIAASAFKEVGAEIVVVGKGGAFLERLRREFPTVRFTGRVETIYPYLDSARIAVVPERLGGGFKLKALDYVFNRLPIATLDSAVDGVPLMRNESVLTFPDLSALVKGLLSAIDDLSLLNRIQERAFAACRDRFQWSTRGRALLDAVGSL
jgi:glycosyltransferase involved in cell wall biosynthesis